MANPKGTPENLKARAGKGRPKGSKNKYTRIIHAFMRVFNAKEFKAWAKENPTLYYQLLVKLLPKEHGVKFEDPRQIIFVDSILETDLEKEGKNHLLEEDENE